MLDSNTLRFVRELADKVSDLDALKTLLDALTIEVRIEANTRSQAVLTDVQKALKLAQIYCAGCNVLVKEGPRTYERAADVVNDLCSVCGKPRYTQDSKPDLEKALKVQRVAGLLLQHKRLPEEPR